MAQYIDKAALIVEIERRIKSVNSCPFRTAELGSEKLDEGQINAYNVMLSFINTLEVKEADLDEHQIADIIQNLFPTDQFIESETLLLNRKEAILFAKHFFELGLKVNQKEE